jgi:hypothetical protein
VTKGGDVRRSEGRVGDNFQATIVVMGMHFDERLTYTEYERPRKTNARAARDMNGTMGSLRQPQGNNAYLTLDMSYQMPGNPMGRAADALRLERMNEKNDEHMLGNIKLIVETQAGGPGRTS